MQAYEAKVAAVKEANTKAANGADPSSLPAAKRAKQDA
jgi:hypothetical protein